MYREKEYFELVQKLLKKYDIAFDNKSSLIIRGKMQYYYNEINFDRQILELCRKEYNIKPEKIVLMNCMKYYLVNKSFCSNLNTDHIRLAAMFTMLGCIMDLIIDFNINNERENILYKLSWDYCSDYFLKGYKAKTNSVVDYIFEKLGSSFIDIKYYDEKAYAALLRSIVSAVASQEYVSKNSISSYNSDIDKSIITNKSLLFTEIGFKIAAFSSERMKEVTLCSEYAGYIFMLIDDICDLYEDINNNQMNSLLFEGFGLEWSNSDRINHAVDNIIDNIEYKFIDIKSKLEIIKELVTGELYDFIVYEIRDWTLSNRLIREGV